MRGRDFLLGRALLDHDCGFCEYEVRDKSPNLSPGGITDRIGMLLGCVLFEVLPRHLINFLAKFLMCGSSPKILAD